MSVERFKRIETRIDLSDEPAPDTFDPKIYPVQERKSRTPPGQTLARKFPHLEYASIPTVDPQQAEDEWSLQITGDALWTGDREILLWDVVHSFPVSEFTQDFHCITGWSIFDTRWEGWSGPDIIEHIGINDDCTTVLVHGRDEFSTTLWLEDFAKGMLAYGYQGRPLRAHHGYPLRFIAPTHLWQYKACKWVTGLEFRVEHKLGFWEIRAYSDSAKAWENDRYANPDATTGKSMRELRKQLKREHT